MYLVFIGSDHTTYMKLFSVFHSFDNALDEVIKLLKKFDINEYEDEYVKTKIMESYEDSRSGYTPNTGIFYFKNYSDMFNEPFIGIRKINVGDYNMIDILIEEIGRRNR